MEIKGPIEPAFEENQTCAGCGDRLPFQWWTFEVQRFDASTNYGEVALKKHLCVVCGVRMLTVIEPMFLALAGAKSMWPDEGNADEQEFWFALYENSEWKTACHVGNQNSFRELLNHFSNKKDCVVDGPFKDQKEAEIWIDRAKA